MAQESTDSGTSLTHRHSEESMCMHPSGIMQATPPTRHGYFTQNDTQETAVKESINGKFTSEQFHFDAQPVVPMSKLNVPKYETKSYRNRSRAARFMSLFRCIAKKTFDDKKLQPFDSPISEQSEPEKIGKELNDRFNQSSYDVSNSSLRDIENGALEDELTIYMKEIQRREKDKS